MFLKTGRRRGRSGGKATDDGQARKKKQKNNKRKSNGWWREFCLTFAVLRGLCEQAKVIKIMDINGFISKH